MLVRPSSDPLTKNWLHSRRCGIAKGIVLISNVGNPYFNQPEFFKHAIVEILRKQTATVELRYRKIHGAVYFSFEMF